MTVEVTPDTIRGAIPSAKSGLMTLAVEAINKWAPKYGVNTPLRMAHFLAQLCHESRALSDFEEDGSRRYFDKYEPGTATGRRLGNVQPGDGYRFRGRGPIMVTGRENYAYYGKVLKGDLLGDPDLAATPDVGIRIALEFWRRNGLNAYADADDCREVTRRINGGYNGLAERIRFTQKFKEELGADDEHATPVTLLSHDDDDPPMPSGAIAEDPPKGMLKSKEGAMATLLGGMSLSEIWDNAQETLLRWTDPETVWAFLTSPQVRPWLVVIAIAAAVWWFRYRRMHGAE